MRVVVILILRFLKIFERVIFESVIEKFKKSTDRRKSLDLDRESGVIFA